MNYKKIGVSVLGLAIATTLLTGCCNQCGQHTMEAGVTPVAASGQIMEDFTLQDIDGSYRSYAWVPRILSTLVATTGQ